jgi:hypothetical protein
MNTKWKYTAFIRTVTSEGAVKEDMQSKRGGISRKVIIWGKNYEMNDE